MNNDKYVPSEDDIRGPYVSKRMNDGATRTHAEQEYRRWLTAHDARAHRYGAREALDGLIADTEIDLRLGIEGGDNLRVQNAEAVIDAATVYRDTEYP